MASLRQANVGNYMTKCSSPLIFTFDLNVDTSVLELFPFVIFQWKGFSMRSVLTHLSQSKPSQKLLDCGRKILNDVHIDTYYCKPELMSWRWINTTVFNTRLLSPTEKHADSSTYWQLLYCHPPGKFRQTPVHRRGVSLKYGTKISICVDIHISI